MDPNTMLETLRQAVRYDGPMTDEDRLELLRVNFTALDEFLSSGGFRPTAWQTFARRTRPVRADDATHPRELPDPVDEAAYARYVAGTAAPDPDELEAIQRELDAHPTWRGDV